MLEYLSILEEALIFLAIWLGIPILMYIPLMLWLNWENIKNRKRRRQKDQRPAPRKLSVIYPDGREVRLK